MKLIPISERQAKILRFIMYSEKDRVPASYISSEAWSGSIATTKRDLAELRKAEYLDILGAGRDSGYTLSTLGRMMTPINPKEHSAKDPDDRYLRERFDLAMLREFPMFLFTDEERKSLLAESSFKSFNIENMGDRKELERFVVELAWKSSNIEGNTYTLLDTEELLLRNNRAEGHPDEEAIMLLNHKKAFEFVSENKEIFLGRPDVAGIRQLHKILTDELGVRPGFRERLVGITGTGYRPPDNFFQIEEAVEVLLDAIAKAEDPHTAALIALAGFSYTQPFEDGNKRAARLITNGILLARGQSPLSYRGVSSSDFKSAMLVFYETGSIVGLKDVFSLQCEFARKHYRLGSQGE